MAQMSKKSGKNLEVLIKRCTFAAAGKSYEKE